MLEDTAGLKLFNLDAPQRFKADEVVKQTSDEFMDEINVRFNDRSRSALWRSWSWRAGVEVPSLGETSRSSSALLSATLFACMDLNQAMVLQKLGTALRKSPGEVLLEKGDEVDPGIFVVLSGHVGVSSAYSSPSCGYAQILKRGDVVAEDHIDLILDERGPKAKYCSSFWVIGDSECELLQLSQAVLCSFFSSNPDALLSYLDGSILPWYSVSYGILRWELRIQQNEATAGRVASALSSREIRLIQGLRGSVLKSIRERKGLQEANSLSDTQLLHAMNTEASPSTGWDVLPDATRVLSYLMIPPSRVIWEPRQWIELDEGSCFVITDGVLIAVRNAPDSTAKTSGQAAMECALVRPGSLINAATCLSSESHDTIYYAASRCTLQLLDGFKHNSWDFLRNVQSNHMGQDEREKISLFESARFLTKLFGPTLRQFQALGFQQQWFSAGQAAFCQGQAPGGFFMVVSGNMKFLQLDADGSLVEKGLVRRGEWVGATGSQPHASSCMAVRDVHLVSVRMEVLPLLSRRHPGALITMYHKAMQRAEELARPPLKSKPPSRTIAIIPGGKPIPDSSENIACGLQKETDAFCKKLEGALSCYGVVLRVDQVSLVKQLPEESTNLQRPTYRAKICRWLGVMEEKHMFLLLVGSSTDPDWTAVCSAQADHVLILGSSLHANPKVSLLENQSVWKPAEAAISALKQNVAKHQITGGMVGGRRIQRSSVSRILASKARSSSSIASELHLPQRSLPQSSRKSLRSLCHVDLVLLHHAGTIPGNAKDWLDNRPLIEHHYHVRKSHDEDVGRIARWVSGNAVGVVLSGGGARGLAHVGVLQALESLQIPIDAIGGTSQGSLIGALYAQGRSVESIYKLMQEYSSICGSVLTMVLDLTMPILSIFKGKSFQAAIKKCLIGGPQDIEDMVTSYFCVATNLSTGGPHVYARGDLLRAVRASMSIVCLVPPIIDENGDVMCDGGYSDNLPVDAMRELGASVVIAVDVEDRNISPWSNLSMHVEGVLSGWQILWDRWCPIPSWTSGRRFPRQQHMLNALCGMAHSQNLAHLARFVHDKHIDLYLRPPVLQYALLDWKFMEDIVSDSRSFSLLEISKWVKTTDASLSPRHSAIPRD